MEGVDLAAFLDPEPALRGSWAFLTMAAAPVAPLQNNPLYVGAGKGAENPLNRVD